jgi:hypothetical protein
MKKILYLSELLIIKRKFTLFFLTFYYLYKTILLGFHRVYDKFNYFFVNLLKRSYHSYFLYFKLLDL